MISSGFYWEYYGTRHEGFLPVSPNWDTLNQSARRDPLHDGRSQSGDACNNRGAVVRLHAEDEGRANKSTAGGSLPPLGIIK